MTLYQQVAIESYTFVAQMYMFFLKLTAAECRSRA